MTQKELEFAVFCIENVAEKTHRDASEIYDILSRKTGILQDYIIPCYDVLHTQSRDYIVDDVLAALSEKGIKL